MHAGKVWLKPSLAASLNEYCEREEILPEERSGFRSNRSTIDMVFVIHWLQELARKKRIPSYARFIDLLIKAYDSVDRTLIWTVLARFGVPQKNRVSVTRQFHDGMRACVRLNGGVCSGCFVVEHGLCQGCVLVPPLSIIFFATVINVAYTRFKVDEMSWTPRCTCRKKRGRRGGEGATAGEPALATSLWDMLYADDAGVILQSSKKLRKMMGVIVVVCAAFGLAVSEAETEF